MDGWMDEVRLSKGVARWTSDFTPPEEEYTTDLDTKLLLHMNGTDGSAGFVDSSQASAITDRLTSIRDPLNRITNSSYDTATENLTRISTDAGEVNYTYDVRDRLTGIQDALGRVTQFQYDDQLEQITETRELGDPLDLLDDIVAAFDYDRFGNLISLAGPLGGATSFAYDVLNSTPDNTVQVSAQLNNPSDNSENWALGVEYGWHELLSLRLGYRFGVEEFTTPSVGVGIMIPNLSPELRFDYSFNRLERLGAVHRIGFNIGL